MTVTIALDDQRAKKLQKLAGLSGQSAEEFLSRLIDLQEEKSLVEEEILETSARVKEGDMPVYTGIEMRKRLGLA